MNRRTLLKYFKILNTTTRMHSTRMRTARPLTVGGGGLCLGREVVCLVQGVGTGGPCPGGGGGPCPGVVVSVWGCGVSCPGGFDLCPMWWWSLSRRGGVSCQGGGGLCRGGWSLSR